MPQVVEIPGQGTAEFPDEMSPDDIASTIHQQFFTSEAPPPKPDLGSKGLFGFGGKMEATPGMTAGAVPPPTEKPTAIRPSIAEPFAKAVDAVVQPISGGRAAKLTDILFGSTREATAEDQIIPEIPAQDSTAGQVGAGIGNVPIRFANFALSPEGVALGQGLGVIPKVGRTLMGLLFGAEEAKAAIQSDTLQEKISHGLGALAIGTGTIADARTKPTLTETLFPTEKPAVPDGYREVTPTIFEKVPPEAEVAASAAEITRAVEAPRPAEEAIQQAPMAEVIAPEPAVPAVDAAIPPAEPTTPKLRPGEKQGDLLAAQTEDLTLVGEKGTDHAARQAETEATAQRAEEARLKAEHEQGLLSDFQEHQSRGGDELMDAVESGGGLPAKSSSRADVLSGELKNIREEIVSETGKQKYGFDYNKIFKRDAPDLDALTQHLRSKGFDVETPNDTLSLIQNRLRTGEPLHGNEARSTALEEASYGEFGIVPPGTAQIIQGTQAATTALKTASAAVRDIPKFTPFRESILKWSATNQKSAGEIIATAKNLTKSVPDIAKREGITNWIQAGGDLVELRKRAAASTNVKLKAGYEAALNLTPEEQALAGKVRQTYDTLLQRAKSYGIEINELENYVNQIWKRQPLKEFSASSNRKLSTNIRFAKERFYDSFFHGEQAGLKPETKDIAKLLPTYINEVNNAISAKAFVEDLSKGVASDGRPLLAPRGSGKVIEGKEGDVHLVFPESVTKDTADYRVIEQPALHNWKWAGTEEATGKTTLVKSDLAVHPEIFNHVKNVLGDSAIREWYRSPSENPLGNIPKAMVKLLLDDVQATGKATMLGFLSPFHQVQEGTHAVGHRINPFGNIPKIDLSIPAQFDAAQHGLMLLPDRVSARQFREGLDGSKNNLLSNALGKFGGKAGKKVKEWADGYQDFLFHEYIPGLKLKTYEHALERNLGRYTEEIKTGAVTESQVKYLTAQQMNAAYGHLNYADMGRNPTMQHILQTFLLAPDFLEARGRFAGQAVRGLTSKVGREQLAALATLAVTQYVAARGLNTILDGDPHWKEPFDVVVGNRRYSMRSVPADMVHLFSDSRRFVSGRLSPLVGRGLLEGLSGVNYRKEPTTLSQTFTNILAGMVPLTVQPFTRGLSETGRDNPVSPFEQLLGSMGLHVSRFSPASEVYSLSHDWVRKHGKEYGIDPREAVYPVSQYQRLRYALEDGDSDRAKAEIAKLMKSEKINRKELDKRFNMAMDHPFTGSKKTDLIFRKTLDERETKVFEAAIQRRKLLIKRYQGIR